MNILRLTDEEKDAILRLIDAAVRGHGINVAEAAVVMHRKVSEAKPEEPSDA
jgi:hypothetical protein